MFDTPTFDDESSVNDLPRNHQGRLQGDEGLRVNFYKKAVKNTDRSASEGRAIFEDHEFIRILIPGDQYNIIDTFATDEHKRRFPVDYDRFSKNADASIVGTPVEQMPGLTPSQIAEFKAMNIRTVEDLADIPDSTPIRGIHDIKRKAKGFLDLSREEAVATRAAEFTAKLQAQEQALAQRDTELAMLRAEVEKLAAAHKKKKED